MFKKNDGKQDRENWERLYVTQKLMLWDPMQRKFLFLKPAESDFYGDHPEYDAWTRVGGHIENGEEILDALKREVKEEVGDIEYEIIGVFQVGRTEKALFVYHLAEYKRGEIILNNESIEYSWFSPEEVEKSERFAPFIKEGVKLAVQKLHEREYLNDLKRLQAEFNNYRKRQQESQKELAGYLIEKFLMDILPVMDNFRAATGHVPADQQSSPWVTGIQYIEKQLEKVLEDNGVSVIAVQEGDTFDPAIHEAVEMQEARSKEYVSHPSVAPPRRGDSSPQAGEQENSEIQEEVEGEVQEQRVAKVIQNGYRIGDRVVRPAKVVVG